MIAFSSGNVFEAGDCRGGCGWIDPDGPNYILSIKCGQGYCVSKALVTSMGLPCQLTIILVFNGQADIAAVPELFSSVYVTWHSADAHRLKETAGAFINAGINEQAACCVAIAVNIIYDVIDRNYVEFAGSAKDCAFTSSGRMELNDDCKDRLFSNEYVLSDYPFPKNTTARLPGEGSLPF